MALSGKVLRDEDIISAKKLILIEIDHPKTVYQLVVALREWGIDEYTTRSSVWSLLGEDKIHINKSGKVCNPT